MYEAPVTIYETAMQTIMEEREGAIFARIQSAFDVDVDKDELLRALRYDRQQYEKGYMDGQAAAKPEWIPVSERLPALHTDDYEEPDGSRVQFEVSDDQWVVTASGYQTKASYETGAVFQGWVGDYGQTVRNVTHWMPLPEPPKGD